MQRRKIDTINNIVLQFLRDNNLEGKILERHVIEKWPEVLGPMVSQYTYNLEVRDGVLHVRILNAALKQELFMNRQLLVQKLNEAVGGQAIRDIRIK